MTTQERINAFIAKYPEPEQFGLNLCWNRKDGRHNAIVGDKNNMLISYTRSVGKPVYAQYYRYDTTLEILEMSYIVINCNTPKENDTRRWRYAARHFARKNERAVYNEYMKRRMAVISTVDNTYTENVNKFFQTFLRLAYNKDNYINNVIPFVGDNNQCTKGYRITTASPYGWYLPLWFAYKEKHKGSGGVQKEIDKLNMGIEEFDRGYVAAIAHYLQEEEKLTRSNNEYWNTTKYTHKIAYFDVKNRVFRGFLILQELKEIDRIFINRKGVPVVATLNCDGEWVTKGSFTKGAYRYPIVNVNDVYRLDHNEYIPHVYQGSMLYNVVSIIKCKDIEQLYNMGMKNIAMRLSVAQYKQAALDEAFGKADKKKKNVCQKYHVTRDQFNEIEKLVRDNPRPYHIPSHINSLKYYLGTNNLSSLDNRSFTKYINCIASAFNGYYKNAVLRIAPSDADRKYMFLRLCNMLQTRGNAAQIFKDTVSLARYLSQENLAGINIWGIKSYEDLVRVHDAVLALQRIEEEERRRYYNMKEADRQAELEKKMVKIDANRVKLNYSDDNFTIRLPDKLSEIVTEGSVLHHCVGGYTDSHARGNTTIMFLRRNSEPNTPFYTIEVREGSIVQIHGMCNKWLGNDPDAIPTVARWLKANDIKCSAQILRSTAKGYSGYNAELVDMPNI